MSCRRARTLSRVAKLGEKAVARSHCAQNRNILFKCPRWSDKATIDDGPVTVLSAIDHCTAECVGFHADATAGLRLRHDHGSQFMSDASQSESRFLGLASSPAFGREPQGNGCIEHFFKTLKEQLLGVRH